MVTRPPGGDGWTAARPVGGAGAGSDEKLPEAGGMDILGEILKQVLEGAAQQQPQRAPQQAQAPIPRLPPSAAR